MAAAAEVGPVRFVDAATVRRALPWGALVEALAAAFREGCEAPPRHRHAVRVPGEPDASLLLMPAWVPGGVAGVKLVTVAPGNAARGLPAVSATYVLSDARTGVVLAVLDGEELTARRTAAASALASRHLSRPDSRRLLVVGAGRIAAGLVEAHAAVRPIAEVEVWARDPAKASAFAARVGAVSGLPVTPADDLASAVGQADVVACATLATEPLVRGAWLRPGTHLDLVGAFTPAMRESDDEAVRRARVYVDTLDGALREAGDLVQPIGSGTIDAGHVLGDLAGLCRGAVAGRAGPDEVTLFKSVGAAIEDLAAARLVHEQLGR